MADELHIEPIVSLNLTAADRARATVAVASHARDRAELVDLLAAVDLGLDDVHAARELLRGGRCTP